MKIRSTLAGLAVATLIANASAPLARAEAAAASVNDVSGTVTKVDPATHRVTVRSADGGTHEFEASTETLAELRVGDRIEAKKRSATEAPR